MKEVKQTHIKRHERDFSIQNVLIYTLVPQIYSKNEGKKSNLPWSHPTLALGCKFSFTWIILLLFLLYWDEGLLAIQFFNLSDFLTFINAKLFFQYWIKNKNKRMPVVEPIREEDWMWFRFILTPFLFLFIFLHTI